MQRLKIGFLLMSALLAATAASAGNPTESEVESFKQRHGERIAACARKIGAQHGLTEPNAVAKCQCQIEVFAAGLNAGEMTAYNHVAFGTENGTRDDSITALLAITRLLGERQKRCGF